MQETVQDPVRYTVKYYDPEDLTGRAVHEFWRWVERTDALKLDRHDAISTNVKSDTVVEISNRNGLLAMYQEMPSGYGFISPVGE